jgi:membrane protease subunit HflK
MAWNEPGNQNDKDPWSDKKGGKQDGPPDLDEVVRNIQGKFDKIFGGKGKGGGSGSPQPGGQSSGYVGVIALIVIAVVAIMNSVFTLDEQERGVVLRVGEFNRVVEPGLQFKIPFLEKVIPVNVTQIRNASMKKLMLTQDENIVEIQMNVQYRIADPVEFALRAEDPHRSLEHSVESSLRHEVGNTALDPILTTGRIIVAEQTALRLQQYMKRYQTGIEVRKVNIDQAQAPVEVQAAFDDVQKAKLDKERYMNEAEAYANTIVPESRGKAQRIIEEANAYKDRVVARAQGETSRFLNLLTEYRKNPEITRERLYLDSIQKVLSSSSKVLVDIEGGNNMLYLPLDKLTQQGAAASSTGARGLGQEEIDEITTQVIEKIRERQTEVRRGR